MKVQMGNSDIPDNGIEFSVHSDDGTLVGYLDVTPTGIRWRTAMQRPTRIEMSWAQFHTVAVNFQPNVQ